MHGLTAHAIIHLTHRHRKFVAEEEKLLRKQKQPAVSISPNLPTIYENEAYEDDISEDYPTSDLRKRQSSESESEKSSPSSKLSRNEGASSSELSMSPVLSAGTKYGYEEDGRCNPNLKMEYEEYETPVTPEPFSGRDIDELMSSGYFSQSMTPENESETLVYTQL